MVFSALLCSNKRKLVLTKRVTVHFSGSSSALPISLECDWGPDIQSANWGPQRSDIIWVSNNIRVPHAGMSEQGLCCLLLQWPFLLEGFFETLFFSFQFGLSLLYALLSQGEKLLSSGVPLEPSIGDFETWWGSLFCYSTKGNHFNILRLWRVSVVL